MPLTYTIELVSLEELKYLTLVTTDLQKLSLDANKDSNTILFFLKITLQNTIRHYDKGKHGMISSNEIINLMISVLQQVIFFSTQVVQIPRSSKTFKNHLINKKISRYVTNSEFEKYKYFKQGLITDPRSAHFLLFYSYLSSTSTKLITRSCFQIFNNTSPLQFLTYLKKIYAPMHLERKDEYSPFRDNFLLQLMGFKIKTSLSTVTNSSIDVIELNYTNPSDFHLFAKSITKDELLNEYKDSLIKNSGFELSKMNKYSYHENEIISIEFDLDYCQEQFKKNKKSFKKLMKKNDLYK